MIGSPEEWEYLAAAALAGDTKANDTAARGDGELE